MLQAAKTTEVKCPYCGDDAKLVTGREIYPHRSDLFRLKFWQCAPCDAYTGTHKNSKRHAPKGRLANAELRQARSAAHAAFDPLWRDGDMSRNEAYAWLREALEKDHTVHIGFLTLEDCQRVVETVTSR